MFKTIAIDELKIGTKFSKPLYDSRNLVVLEANLPVNKQFLETLKNKDVKEFYTKGEIINSDDIDESTYMLPEYALMYKWCIEQYAIIREDFLKEDNIKFVILQDIGKKIFEIIDSYQDDIIGYICFNNDEYESELTHAINTAILSIIAGSELKLSQDRLERLMQATLVHDIGMLKIPREILDKNVKLSDDEYKIVKTHPVIAYKFLNKYKNIHQDILDAVLQHHEQFDGKGYPRRLSGDKIHIYAKIIAIADTFDALITHRAYRKSTTGYNAMKEMLAEAQNSFDPKVLRAFLKTMSIYPPGTLIQLNNNSIGIVLSANTNVPLRPKIKILLDQFGDRPDNPTIIDLTKETSIFVMSVLDKEQYKHKQNQ